MNSTGYAGWYCAERPSIMTITSHGVPSMRLPFRGCQKVRRDSWAYWMEYPCERFCFQVQGYNIPIRNEILANALVKLSEKKRDIILLAYFLDMTDQEIADKLEILVKAKFNIFISGGTGSGKTTFLNALSNYIPRDERIITIEDSAELQITGVDNLVSMETRNANSAGAGAITIRDLIKSSLRMRPERIVVGEVRGGEALDMLQAMNTGHDGSLSTGHANSTKDMLSRLETMVLQGADGLPLEAIRQQIASALDIIIHLSRLRDKSRKTMEITEVVGYKNGPGGGEIILNPLYVFEEDEDSTLEHVSGSLKRTGNPIKNDFKLQLMGYQGEW